MIPNRRQYYRINYPYNTSPKILFGGRNLEVLNLSENGMLLRDPATKHYKIGSTLIGKLVFPSGESIMVWGEVKRISTDSLAIQFLKNIPLGIIMSEQRRVINLIKQRA